MKKISNWSLLGIFAGLVFGLGSFVRYFIFYIDYDRALVYSLIGIIIILLSWAYNRLLQLSNRITGLEDYLSNEDYTASKKFKDKRGEDE